MSLRHAIAAAAVVMNASVPAYAGSAVLDFTSLPSSQGWTYVTDYAPESAVFSVAGNTLYMDSTSANGAYYKLDNVVDPSLSFSLSARARSVSGSYALAFYVEGGGEVAAIHISPSSIIDQEFNVLASLDNTIFHDYRIQGVFGSTYTLFVDNSPVATTGFSSGGGNLIILGDGGGVGSGLAEVTAFSFQQPIPEPETVLLMVVGLGVLFARLRVHENTA